jgi:hypothetical protein
LEADDANIIYIVDGHTPIYAVVETVLITSPKHTVWKAFQKQQGAEVFYVPIFTLPELLKCRSLCFSHVAEERVVTLFERWGGSAIYTLKAPLLESA